MALTAASFSDPMMRDDLHAYYDKMKVDAIAGIRARGDTPAGPVKIRNADGTTRDVELIPISAEKMEKAFVSFDKWLELQTTMFERYEDGPTASAHGVTDGEEQVVDFARDQWNANVTKMNTFLLSLQEAEPAVSEGTGVGTYDFSNMTRGEIADVGKKLFNEGKITIDELFRFEHPDGRLKIGLNGEPIQLNPYDRVDFIGFTQKAITDMEATGEAQRPDSGYKMFVDLLDKLLAWKA